MKLHSLSKKLILVFPIKPRRISLGWVTIINKLQLYVGFKVFPIDISTPSLYLNPL